MNTPVPPLFLLAIHATSAAKGINERLLHTAYAHGFCCQFRMLKPLKMGFFMLPGTLSDL